MTVQLGEAKNHIKLTNTSSKNNSRSLRGVTMSSSLLNSLEIDKSLKKHHRYIYWVSHSLGKIHSIRPLRPTQVTANLKSYL